MERKMKDSGIPWIGMIPSDWEVCYTKQLMRNKSIKGFPDCYQQNYNLSHYQY